MHPITGSKHIYSVKPVIKIMTVVPVLASVFLVVVLATQWQIDEPNEEYYVWGMLVFFATNSIFLILSATRFKLIISQNKLTHTYILKRPVTIYWDEIEVIKIRASNGSIIIHGEGKKIALSRDIINFDKAFNTIIEIAGKDKITYVS